MDYSPALSLGSVSVTSHDSYLENSPDPIPITQDEDHDLTPIGKEILIKLSALREDSSLSDVVVSVSGKEFKCHRVILAAVSDYFKDIFTSNMSETIERKVNLDDIDTEVFSVLLDSIYSHKDLVTKENLLQIWPVAERLRINVIASQCQRLFKKLLRRENCISFCSEVRCINSDAHTRALEFVTAHFTTPLIKRDIHKLTAEEIKTIVSSEELVVDSEDVVIYTVLRWAEYNSSANPESSNASSWEKKRPSQPSQLAYVLFHTRFLLISRGCYDDISQNLLVRGDPTCQGMLQMISKYQCRAHLKSSWCVMNAIHRKHSDMINVVFVSNDHERRKELPDKVLLIWAYNVETKKLKEVVRHNNSPVENLQTVTFYDSEIYASSDNNLFRYKQHKLKWEKAYLEDTRKIDLIINDSLYSFHENTGSIQIHRLIHFQNAFERKGLQWTFVDEVKTQDRGRKVRSVTSLENILIFFYTVHGNEKFKVQCYNLGDGGSKTFETHLESSSKLVTVRSSHGVTVLQENGCVSKIERHIGSSIIKIKQEHILWEGKFQLSGAFIYNRSLMVVGDFPGLIIFTNAISGVNRVVKLKNFHGCPSSSLAVAVMAKQWWEELEPVA